MVELVGHMAKQRILAFDPGYDRLGWAGADVMGGQLQLLGWGCITTQKNHSFNERLGELVREVEKVLMEMTPEVVVLETLLFSKNQTTALAVAEVRGSLKTCATQQGCSIFEYNPGSVKLAAAGHGKATKAQVEKMVRLQLGKQLPSAKLLDDTLDALALLITHAASVRWPNRV